MKKKHGNAGFLRPREETQERDDGETTTPLTLLKRLNAYRKQCESNGEYVEAQKARRKYEETFSGLKKLETWAILGFLG